MRYQRNNNCQDIIVSQYFGLYKGFRIYEYECDDRSAAIFHFLYRFSRSSSDVNGKKVSYILFSLSSMLQEKVNNNLHIIFIAPF